MNKNIGVDYSRKHNIDEVSRNKGLSNSSRRQFNIADQPFEYYDLYSLEEEGYDIKHLPYSIKVLLESVLRQWDGHVITEEHIRYLADWSRTRGNEGEVPFKPARVILQDFTGVPAVVDLASMRAAMQGAGINPEVPVDLVIDHSVQVDCYGSAEALEENMKLEFERNSERYRFLNWAQKSFDNLTIVPPSTGIVHQVNLEYLARVVILKEIIKKDEAKKDEAKKDEATKNEATKNEAKKDVGRAKLVFPDTLVGTDSHTTMINGLGVLGWGVGGIEAEAGMLGQPSYFPTPEVVGVHLTGALSVGVTATDLALRITNLLRKRGVVGKFVEYFGSGMSGLSLADRATIANMAPEYGATCGFFPVDDETLDYLELTGRSAEQVKLIRTYLKTNGMYYDSSQEEPIYTEVIELDLSTVDTALSGPKRPQDLIPLGQMKEAFLTSITAPLGNQGHGCKSKEMTKEVDIKLSDGRESTMKTGAVVIAAITSCTNTSNPSVMLGAGLLARNAVQKGLSVPAHVKTSLAPGSKVVTGYLEASKLQPYLDELGFQTVGYGCTTCIGNSGPLSSEISSAILDNDLLVTSVLSGNRNFEGRIHSQIKANYLASPPLVVAYALAGTMNIDLVKEPIGTDKEGNAVYLRDIWPNSEELMDMAKKYVIPELFSKEYKAIYDNNEVWNSIEVKNSSLYEFAEDSTYIRNPPFFEDMARIPENIKPIKSLRVIASFGDSITTDHISPAGSIGRNTSAGKYLSENGVEAKNYNTYGSRRGNHEVMMRGTFANIRIRNLIAPGTEGGFTTYWPTGEVMPIYDACIRYKEQGTGLLVLAGKDYGMGSSRDWAAKGPSLLGVKVVIAESYERIHRSNLVMMGILPLQFLEGECPDNLGLTGEESFEVQIGDNVSPRDILKVNAVSVDGNKIEFDALVRFDSIVDVDYYRHGGILQMVLRERLNANEN
ncbi:MAG TPA: aconitate hydratase AcnA [Mobilitalea sp.]|nr:aconitate hydratase AcnA [Mobilitalea sp.]